MLFVWRTQKKRVITILCFVLSCWLIAGCLHTPTKPEPEPEPVPVYTPAPCPPDKTAEMESKNAALQEELASNNNKIQALKRSIADQQSDITSLKLQVLEYEAWANDLKRRSENQQNRLDAAIIEVVRAKAKLRSLESKAEAASTLAEAEIAVNALKKRMASADEIVLDEISTAEQLLNMSVKEFKAQNYGGALYLANQTKGHVQAVQNRYDQRTQETALEGVSAFAQPLKLKVLKKSNLRGGPGLDRKIIGTLIKGTMITGYAYKGSWIRVETQEGQAGWIFHELVGAP